MRKASLTEVQQRALVAVEALDSGDTRFFENEKNWIGTGMFVDALERGWILSVTLLGEKSLTLTPAGRKTLEEARNG